MILRSFALVTLALLSLVTLYSSAFGQDQFSITTPTAPLSHEVFELPEPNWWETLKVQISHVFTFDAVKRTRQELTLADYALLRARDTLAVDENKAIRLFQRFDTQMTELVEKFTLTDGVFASRSSEEAVEMFRQDVHVDIALQGMVIDQLLTREWSEEAQMALETIHTRTLQDSLELFKFGDDEDGGSTEDDAELLAGLRTFEQRNEKLLLEIAERLESVDPVTSSALKERIQKAAEAPSLEETLNEAQEKANRAREQFNQSQ